MRYWENIEVPGRGTKFCLVMDPEDGTHPIKTYGWSKDEVLEKVAKTAEAAQQLINRQRSQSPQTPAATSVQVAAPAIPAAPKRLTADERMQATLDLSNPAKSPEAIRALLRDSGVDVDKMKLDADANRAAVVAQEWERNHPDFPSDDRNKRLLMNTALLRAGGDLSKITAVILDTAYSELTTYGMLYDPEASSSTIIETPQNAPDGNSATRIVRPRGATSYRSTSLRATAPGAKREPKYTRAEIDAMPSAVFREKMEREAGFREWYDREFSAATA